MRSAAGAPARSATTTDIRQATSVSSVENAASARRGVFSVLAVRVSASATHDVAAAVGRAHRPTSATSMSHEPRTIDGVAPSASRMAYPCSARRARIRNNQVAFTADRTRTSAAAIFRTTTGVHTASFTSASTLRARIALRCVRVDSSALSCPSSAAGCWSERRRATIGAFQPVPMPESKGTQ